MERVSIRYEGVDLDEACMYVARALKDCADEPIGVIRYSSGTDVWFPDERLKSFTVLRKEKK